MLTLMLLVLAGQTNAPPADSLPPSSAPVVLEVRTWTGLKQHFSETAPVPAPNPVHEAAANE